MLCVFVPTHTYMPNEALDLWLNSRNLSLILRGNQSWTRKLARILFPLKPRLSNFTNTCPYKNLRSFSHAQVNPTPRERVWERERKREREKKKRERGVTKWNLAFKLDFYEFYLFQPYLIGFWSPLGKLIMLFVYVYMIFPLILVSFDCKIPISNSSFGILSNKVQQIPIR